MSLEGFICPDHGEKPGRENNIDYCITKCSNPCTAPHVLASILESEKGDYHTGKRISVTMLTGGCKRQTLLERTLPYYLEPKRGMYTFRGRLIHDTAEMSSEFMEKFGWKIELKLELPIITKSGEWILTGTLDAYDPERSTLYDIKTLQDYGMQKLILGQNKGKYSDHIPDQYIKQLNIYKYMGKKLELFDAKKLRIQIITFGNLILTGNTQEIGLKKGYRWTVEDYEIPDVPILPDEEIEELIKTEGDQWYRIMFAGEKAPIRDEEFSWLCKNCYFNKTRYCPDPEAEAEGENVWQIGTE